MTGERSGFALQPGRVEYSYPLKGDQERSKSVKALQQLTVDLLALHNMYKEAHWDLTGPLYVPLHEYFQQQADFYLQQADLFAERVLHLGAAVDGRFSTIARTTKLAEMPDGYLTDDHSIKLLLDRVTVLQKEIYELIGETEAERPADGQQAARPGVLGGQEPVAVTGPRAEAEFAPGRSTLVSVSGQRTFGPLSIVPLDDRTPTTVARVSPLRKARRCHEGRPASINTAHRTPAALPSRAPRNDAPGPFALSGRAAQESTTLCPSLEGPESSTSWIEESIHEESKSRCRLASRPRRCPRRRGPRPAERRARAGHWPGRAAPSGADSPRTSSCSAAIEQLGKDMLYDDHHVESHGLCLCPVPRPHDGLHVGARIDRQFGAQECPARGRARPVGQSQGLHLRLRRVQPGGPLLRLPAWGLDRREFLGWPCL